MLCALVILIICYTVILNYFFVIGMLNFSAKMLKFVPNGHFQILSLFRRAFFKSCYYSNGKCQIKAKHVYLS